MFEKFTEKAKRILFLARYEASQQGSKVIGSEHILLGLLKEGEETTRELFSRANVSMDLLLAELERRGPTREKLSTSVEIPFSEETKKSLQFAEEEAERLMHPHIGTEHLLLGLLRQEDSVAGRMLAGALVIAGASNLLGFLTSGPRTFVAAILGIVYVAMSDGGQPPFDFAGMAAKFASEAAIAWAVAAVLLAIASVAAPRFSRVG